MPPLPRPIEQRFWPKVEKGSPAECWLWKGAVNNQGYGQILFNGKVCLASRVSWVMHIGPVPDGLFVLHHCDTPACINPGHLFLGTQTDNMADMAAKGRNGHSNKTTCIHGHPYTEKNTRWYKRRRFCRICKTTYRRNSRHRRREARQRLVYLGIGEEHAA